MTVAIPIFLIVCAGGLLLFALYRLAGLALDAIRRAARNRKRRQARLELERSLINRTRS